MSLPNIPERSLLISMIGHNNLWVELAEPAEVALVEALQVVHRVYSQKLKRSSDV